MFNKRLNIILLMSGIMILVLVSIVLAAGRYPWTAGAPTVAKEIPNVTRISPVKGQSGCVTTQITKGAVQGQYSSMDGYLSHEAEVYTIYSSMATQRPRLTPAVVDWKLDGTPVAVGPTFGFTNSRTNSFKRATQEIYSGVKRTIRSCTRRQ